MRTSRVCAFTLLVGLCSLSGTVRADDGAAAVLPMQGPQAAKVRQRVQSGLRAASVPMVPLKKVTAVTKKTKGYAKQAAKLDATILIGGRIRRSGDRWIADVGIRDASGARVRKFRATSSAVGRLSSRIVTVLMGSGLMPGKGDASEGVTKLGVGAAEAKTVEAPVETPTVPQLVVRPFEGPQASKVRGAAVRGLKGKPVGLVPNKKFAQKASALNANLAADEGHVPPSRALGVNALLEGEIVREDGIWSAYLRLVDGESTDVISQHYYEGETSTELAREVQARLWDDFRKDVGRFDPTAGVVVAAAPTMAATPTEARDTKPDREPKERKARPPKRDRPAAVDIEFDFKFVHRELTWKDDLLGNLRDYTLKFGPGIQTKFQYFPGAHFTSGVGAQFGVDFEYERLFSFDSERDDGLQFPTTSQQFLVGIRWRYPAGRWEPMLLAGYGLHKFEFGVSQPPVNTAGIPGVRYQFYRLGGGFRVGLGERENFIIIANASFRGLISAGGIESDVWFPDANGNGMDALLMFAYGLPKGFEVRVGVDYRRYWFDLNPIPPDPPYVAGGALDQYWGLSIGAAWRY
ncbi:MAG: hypothetical protein WBG86_03065 [Polyangiales bacterium]